jgi:hypothetical protein
MIASALVKDSIVVGCLAHVKLSFILDGQEILPVPGKASVEEATDGRTEASTFQLETVGFTSEDVGGATVCAEAGR